MTNKSEDTTAMKKGEKVKLMTYREIDDMFPTVPRIYDNLRFVSEMIKYCGKEITLVSCYRRENRHGYVWNVKENSWVWHEDWLLPISPTIKFLKDEDFEI